jgi:hypothetical protein
MDGKFYKLLSADRCHNGFRYKEGLNVDTKPFVAFGECYGSGLYFTSFEHIPYWYTGQWTWIADVTVPTGACVHAEPRSWKASQLVLSKIRPLSEFFAELDEATLCQALSRNGVLLEHVRNQTDAACMAAVLHDRWALHYVRNQTNAICMATVQRDGMGLCHVRNQTNEICRAAVAQNPHAKMFVNIDF